MDVEVASSWWSGPLDKDLFWGVASRIPVLIWTDVRCENCHELSGQFKLAEAPGMRDPPTWCMRVRLEEKSWPMQGPKFHRRQVRLVGRSEDYCRNWIKQKKTCCQGWVEKKMRVQQGLLCQSDLSECAMQGRGICVIVIRCHRFHFSIMYYCWEALINNRCHRCQNHWESVWVR